jgi:PKD repeat protein
VARAVRSLLVALAALASALPAGASAATRYDPDALALGSTPTANVDVTSATCTFDTNTGAISGGAGCPTRGVDTSGEVVAGISAVVVPSGVIGEPDTVEFVMNSLTVDSGATITFIGSRNLALATLHDLTVGGGGAVDANGLGGTGGGPGGAGSGPGGGDHSILKNCEDAGGGGSFGGFGGDGGNGVPSGGMYGSLDQSQLLNQGSGGGGAGTGAGCGTQAGGNGGGGVALIAMGTLTVNGTVSANGTSTSPTSDLPDQGGPGAGSGGAILLMAPHLALANQSVATAKGGYGWSTSMSSASGGGGGGGGRIATVSDQPSSAFSPLSVTSGLGGTTADPAPVGLAGAQGNGGSIGAVPFLQLSGPSAKQAGQAATFTATQEFGDSTFFWDFGDGTSGTGTNPSHTYSAPGNYAVTITSTLTDSGQTASANRSISITAAPTPPGGGGGGGTTMPTPTPAVQHCIVPKLKGLSLRAAKNKLARAHCKLGKVKKPKLRKGTKKKPKLVIVKQSPANRTLPAGTRVNVTLAPKKKPKPRHH